MRIVTVGKALTRHTVFAHGVHSTGDHVESRIVALEVQAFVGDPWSVAELVQRKGCGQYGAWGV